MLLTPALARAASEPTPAWPAIRGYIERFKAEPEGSSQSIIVYNLLGAIERREIRLASHEETDSLVTFLSTLLVPGDRRTLAARVTRFLASYPHPAAADSLWRLVETGDRVNDSTNDAPVKILAALGDRRVVPILIDRIASGNEAATGLLASLSDSSSTIRLETIASDSSFDTEVRERAAAAARVLRAGLAENLVDGFGLPPDLKATLVRSGFCAAPSGYNEMFEIYGPEYPFVTPDVMWHTWMILMRAARDELEKLVLGPRVKDLSVGLVEESLKQADGPGPEIRDLALQNAAFFAVPAALLTGDDAILARLPDKARERARGELALLRGHQGIETSRVLDRREDYSRYESTGDEAVTGWLDRRVPQSRNPGRGAEGPVRLAFGRFPDLFRRAAETSPRRRAGVHEK